MAKTIVGLFEHFEDAQKAVSELQSSGFRREDISVAANDASGALTRNMGDLRDEMNVERVVEHRDNDHAQDVGKGAGVGAILGGAIGLLFGMGAVAIPGIGPLLVAGPLLSLLTGAGIGAATGGLIGALSSAGLSDAEAREYSGALERGGTLVMVNAPDDMIDRAENILDRHSPLNVREPADVRDMSLPGTQTRTQAQVGDDTYVREDAEIRTTSEDALATAQTNVLSTTPDDADAEREVEEEAKDEVASRASSAAPGMTYDAGRSDLGVAESNRRPQGGMGSDDRNDVADRQRGGLGGSSSQNNSGHAEVFTDPVSASDSAGLAYGQGDTSGEAERFEEYDNDFRSDYVRNYSNSNYGYETYQQAYHYGFDLNTLGQYRGRNWNEIEVNVRREWERDHPGHAWEDFKEAIRVGWDHLRGRR
jgi:hypothetical protein